MWVESSVSSPLQMEFESATPFDFCVIQEVIQILGLSFALVAIDFTVVIITKLLDPFCQFYLVEVVDYAVSICRNTERVCLEDGLWVIVLG